MPINEILSSELKKLLQSLPRIYRESNDDDQQRSRTREAITDLTEQISKTDQGIPSEQALTLSRQFQTILTNNTGQLYPQSELSDLILSLVMKATASSTGAEP